MIVQISKIKIDHSDLKVEKWSQELVHKNLREMAGNRKFLQDVIPCGIPYELR